MLGKKRLLILTGMAIVTFGVSFVVSLFLGGEAVPPSAQGEEARAVGGQGPLVKKLLAGGLGKMKPGERELEELIKEVRHKITVCQQRELELDEREKRVQIAQDLLKKQAEELDYLRSQLVTPLNDLKEERKKLLQTQIRLNRREAANLKKIAARYEKMDSATGAEIMAAMCANNQRPDAVKLLFLMSDRAAGKVLSEITDRKLAAELLNEMKQIELEEDKVD